MTIVEVCRERQKLLTCWKCFGHNLSISHLLIVTCAHRLSAPDHPEPRQLQCVCG